MTIIFFGSSSFSIPVAEALFKSSHTVSLIVTTPPKKKGRGRAEAKSIVHEWALAQGIPCEAPTDLKSLEFQNRLTNLRPDYFVVASYGKILPPSLLKIPARHPLNIHPSLLPKYRGASPIASQLLNGEKTSGVTIARVSEKIDAGDVFAQESIAVNEKDDGIVLTEKLAVKAALLLIDTLQKMLKEELHPVSQNETDATHTKKLNKEMGRIDWAKNARDIHNQIRAFVPWPSSFTIWKEKRVKILKSELIQAERSHQPPGHILEIRRMGPILVQAGSGVLGLDILQPESGRPVTAHEFAIGFHLKSGQNFQ